MKILKKLINSGLAALLFCASLFSVFKAIDIKKPTSSIEASAASNTDDPQKTTYPLKKNGFAFAPGAAVGKKPADDGSHRLNELTFSLMVKDQDLWDICDDMFDFARYTFTLYRRNSDGNDIEMAQKTISTRIDSYMISSKNKGHFDGTFEFENPYPAGLENLYRHSQKEIAEYEKLTGEEVEYYGGIDMFKNYGTDLVWTDDKYYFEYPFLRLVVKTQDLNTNYFVRLNIQISDYVDRIHKDKWYTTKDYYDVYNTYDAEGNKTTKKIGPLRKSDGIKSYSYTTTIDSEVRSSIGILRNMEEQGEVETEFSSYPTVLAEAQELLGYKVEKPVKIRYLKQIGDTHFAERVEETKKIVVSNGSEDLTTLPTDRAAAEFNNAESFYCISSPCIEFQLNSTLSGTTLVYDAIYYKSIYLNVRTVDGNTAGEGTATSEKCCLHINQTYEEFYKPFVDGGVFSQDLYESMFSSILDENKELVGKTESDLYGYWGYVVIPNTYTINELWSKMFDTETTYGGIIKKKQYKEGLSWTAYDKLLKEFQYSWLERAWNGVEGFAEGMTWSANHYIFYADYKVEDTYIDEAGGNGTGDSGAVVEDVKDAMNKITQAASDAMTTIKEETADEMRAVKILLGIVGGVALVAGIAYIVIKLKGMYAMNGRR